MALCSGLAIRRVPNRSAEAAAIYAQIGVEPGKLVLIHGDQIYTGRRVFWMTWPVVVRSLWARRATRRKT